jgi:alpha-beta hydrolase superfamily lysophospholipase
MSPVPPPSAHPPSETGFFAASDGVQLAWYRWDPEGAPRGTICLGVGHGEHVGRYAHVAAAFARKGFVFQGMDWRGHGNSEGTRGDAPSYQQLLDDYSTFFDRAPKPPRFAYGHSLGGQVILNWAIAHHGAARGILATDPWLRLAFPAPAGKVLMARTLRHILPSMAVATGLEIDALSRDREVCQAYRDDPLVHDRLSFRLGIALLEGGAAALGHAGEVRDPILLVHGTADRIIDPDGTREYFDRVGSADKTLKMLPDVYHEPHNDLGWEQVVAQLTGWAEARAG